jgi:hypothetical protein
MRRFTAVLLAAAGLWALSFGASGALAVAPTVSALKVSGVTTGSATLEGDVNPQSKIITYHFEYGAADCASSFCTATKDVKLAAGSSPVHVTETVAGLSAGTTYHYRLVAKNGLGETAASPDRTFMTYLPPQGFAACPNDQLRRENPAKARIEYSSANLPECRAYEQASPVDKDGGDATGIAPFVRSSLGGDAISFLSVSGVPGADGAQDFPPYLANRGAEWSTHGLLPPAATGQQAAVLGWDPDFTDVFTKATQLGEPPQTTFMENSGAGGKPSTIAPYLNELSPDFAGASEGNAEVLFESGVAIPGVAGAIEGRSNLYLWLKASGELSLASVMNDGQAPSAGAFAGSYDWINGTSSQTLARGGAALRYYTQDTHAISADGSAVFFTAAGSGRLYERLNPTAAQSATDGEGNCTQLDLGRACTINLSASHRTIPDPAGTRPAAFQGASTDGSKALFTSSEMLTDDANTGPEQKPATIERAGKETGAGVVPDLVTTHGTAVAVDAEHIYWISPETGAIERAKLDGSGTQSEFITATDNPKGLAVSGGEIYWANAAKEEGEGTIGRAQLNGEAPATGIDEDFIAEAGNPKGVAVDAEHLYWTNDHLLGKESDEGTIGRAKTNGTEADAEFFVLPGHGTETLSGIAVDGEHIYWINSFHLSEVDRVSHISRIKLDGSSYTFDFVPLGENVGARDLAGDGAHLYWTEQANETIGRAKLNGEGSASEVQPGFIEGANHPIGIAVDGTNLYWSANGESAPNPGNDLYFYDARAKALSDLVPDSSSPHGIDVKGVLGTSADASVVYFAANGVPAGVTGSPNARGEAAQAGDCEGILSAQASGVCNLYRYGGGEVRFIARLDSSGGKDRTDGANWTPTGLGIFVGTNFQRTARVSADGQTLLFRSQRQLSDYPNEGVSQFYLYRAGGGGTLGCVSCNPSGEAPFGVPGLGNITTPAVIPTPPAATLSHNLSADGKQVFFETTDALVGADTNGDGGCPLTGAKLQKFPACTDVYEWEAAGKGSCEAQLAVAGGGCLYLISTGKGTKPQMLGDASADGKNVFFFTRSHLVGQDEDQLQDVYDARVEGGLAAQNQPPPTSCLSTEACHGDASSGPTITPAPQFSGPGNPKPKGCPKGKHKVEGRCAKNKKHKVKKHHGKGKAHNKGRAAR